MPQAPASSTIAQKNIFERIGSASPSSRVLLDLEVAVGHRHAFETYPPSPPSALAGLRHPAPRVPPRASPVSPSPAELRRSSGLGPALRHLQQPAPLHRRLRLRRVARGPLRGHARRPRRARRGGRDDPTVHVPADLYRLQQALGLRDDLRQRRAARRAQELRYDPIYCRRQRMSLTGDQQMSEKRVIAVTGATGAQGGGLVRAIVADRQGPFVARGGTRKPEAETARALAAL